MSKIWGKDRMHIQIYTKETKILQFVHSTDEYIFDD